MCAEMHWKLDCPQYSQEPTSSKGKDKESEVLESSESRKLPPKKVAKERKVKRNYDFSSLFANGTYTVVKVSGTIADKLKEEFGLICQRAAVLKDGVMIGPLTKQY